MKPTITVIANASSKGFIIGESLTGESFIVHNVPRTMNIFQHDVLQVVLSSKDSKNIASFSSVKKRNYTSELIGRLHKLPDESLILEVFNQIQINNPIPVQYNNVIKNYTNNMYVIGNIKPNHNKEQDNTTQPEYIFIPTQTMRVRTLPNRTYRFKRLHDNFPSSDMKFSGNVKFGTKDINYSVEYDHNTKKITELTLDCSLGVIIWNYGEYNPDTRHVVWNVNINDIWEVEKALRLINTIYYRNIHGDLNNVKYHHINNLIELYNMVYKEVSKLKGDIITKHSSHSKKYSKKNAINSNESKSDNVSEGEAVNPDSEEFTESNTEN